MNIRKVARIVLINNANRILLLKYEDKTVFNNEKPNCKPFWVTPGGTLYKNESFEEAAKRELFEETGLKSIEIGKLVWNRVHNLNWKGQDTKLIEKYYITHTDEMEIKLDNLTSNEKKVYRSHKWWVIEEICNSNEVFFPENIGQLLLDIINENMDSIPINIK